MLPRLCIFTAAGTTAVAAAATDSRFRVAAAAAASKETATDVSKSSSTAESRKPEKRQIRACELPIYEEPTAVQFEVVPVKTSAYYQTISEARKWVWTYRDSIKDTTRQVTDVYDAAKKYSLDGLQYIQKDSGTVPRAIFISVSGLVGIVFAFRGGFIRKSFYASAAMAGAASVCYPDEARDITTRGWKAARGIIITAYKDLSGIPSNEPLEKKKVTEPVAKKVQPDKPTGGELKSSEVKSNPASANKSAKKDFGMSKPEDQDMYSTRGK